MTDTHVSVVLPAGNIEENEIRILRIFEFRTHTKSEMIREMLMRSKTAIKSVSFIETITECFFVYIHARKYCITSYG